MASEHLNIPCFVDKKNGGKDNVDFWFYETGDRNMAVRTNVRKTGSACILDKEAQLQLLEALAKRWGLDVIDTTQRED